MSVTALSCAGFLQAGLKPGAQQLVG